MTHMSMTSTPLAIAADYADALMTARRARTLLALAIGFLLVVQLAVFFLAKYDVLGLGTPTKVAVPVIAATQPAEGATATQPATAPTATVTATTVSFDATPYVRYAVPLINFAVIVLAMLLVVTMLLLVVIMLVGRLVGVSHVTAAFLWSALFLILVIPWQTFFIPTESYAVTGSSIPGMIEVPEQPALKMPGALYTWPELKRDYKFENSPMPTAAWMWGRYAGLPGLALLVLLLALFKSGRGLKFALGEAEVHVDVTTRSDPMAM
jgi:hypothetical protein